MTLQPPVLLPLHCFATFWLSLCCCHWNAWPRKCERGDASKRLVCQCGSTDVKHFLLTENSVACLFTSTPQAPQTHVLLDKRIQCCKWSKNRAAQALGEDAEITFLIFFFSIRLFRQGIVTVNHIAQMKTDHMWIYVEKVVVLYLHFLQIFTNEPYWNHRRSSNKCKEHVNLRFIEFLHFDIQSTG